MTGLRSLSFCFCCIFPAVVLSAPITFDYELVARVSPEEPGTAYFSDFSLNDAGYVSYITQKPVLGQLGGYERVVNRNTLTRIHGGETTVLHTDQIYEPGPRFDSQFLDLTMNNLGDVGFRLIAENTGHLLLYEAKANSDTATSIVILGELMNQGRMGLNNQGDYAWGNRQFGGIGRFQPERTALPTGDVSLDTSINNSGTIALSSFDYGNGNNYVDVVRFTNPNQPWLRDEATFVIPDTYLQAISSKISLNDLDAVAWAQQTASGSNFALKFGQPFANGNVFDVTELSGSSIRANTREIGLNNLNSILFSGQDFSDPSSTGGYYMISGDGSNLRTVVDFSDKSALNIGNLVAGNIDVQGGSSQIDDERLNNRDEALFTVSYSDGSSALWKAVPKVGSSAANPVLPDPASQNADGSWDISLNQCTLFAVCYFDPEYATGYEYVLSRSGAAFGSVIIPTALGGGDGVFELFFGGITETLYAGQTFDFTTYFDSGVSSFSIFGIDIEEMLDPNDPSAFVTGVSLLGDLDGELSVNMKALTTFVGPHEVPEPSSLALVGLGLIGLTFRKLR